MNAHRCPRMTINPLESLDDRIVPSGLGVSPAKAIAQEAIVTAKGGSAIGAVYQDYVNYEQSGGKGAFQTSESSQIVVRYKAVEVDIQEGNGNFNAVVKQFKGLGMEVSSSSASTGLIKGYLPISELPTVAANNHTVGIASVVVPGAITISPPVTVTTTPVTVTTTPMTVTTPAVTITLPSATVTTPTASASATASTVASPVVTPSVVPASASTPVLSTADDTQMEAVVTDRAGTLLGSVYAQYVAYEEAGGQGTFTPTAASEIQFEGDSVGLDVRFSGSITAFVSEMQELGMDVTATSAASGIVEGFLPIAQLPAVAVNGSELSISPMFRETLD